jgi:hypothetical protein
VRGFVTVPVWRDSGSVVILQLIFVFLSIDYQGWKKPGFKKNPQPGVFLGFIGFLGFIVFFNFGPIKLIFFVYIWLF